MYSSFPLHRARRTRNNNAFRNLVRENHLSIQDLIYPLFIIEGHNQKIEIASMPGCFRLTIDLLLKEIAEAVKLGIQHIAIFPVIPNENKSESADEAYNPNGLTQTAIKEIKNNFPEICLITDIALDPYTIHGHDGICDSKGNILNDQTVEILCKMAIVQAEAGADIVAPSDMMDGRVYSIRQALDKAGFQDTLILSYSAKYASSFYGPFRDALNSHLNSNLQFGDKKTYQMDIANAKEAEKEILHDEAEGADMVMVKPGLAYLDIVYRASQITTLPIIVYSVSGEYSMIKAAAQNGWLNEKQIVLESMIAFKRAGASGIITYFAKDIARYLTD
ncbi:MAG: porphobilinogen synthase [Candidatus Melainabacteria bacterium]|jgi:porphobilinogen synthase